LGVKGPRNPILGSVLAGKVVEIGSKVQDISVGDEVYAMQGIKMGGYAEYSTIKDRGAIALKPCNASFAEATAILFGGTTAIHFLNKANISNAKTILIYGATGDVGIAALQIAQLYGLDVTAVCSERGKDLSQALGAKTIIDYEKEDFTATGKVFDIVFDAVGYTSEKACKHLVSPNGKFITVGGMDVAKERKEDLQQLADWYDQGEIKAVIDRTYAFDDLIKAHEYVDTERKKGSVIINVAE
jgi:NADPH:quinone reductase-like Zn-dependent oxidoreductase